MYSSNSFQNHTIATDTGIDYNDIMIVSFKNLETLSAFGVKSGHDSMTVASAFHPLQIELRIKVSLPKGFISRKGFSMDHWRVSQMHSIPAI